MAKRITKQRNAAKTALEAACPGVVSCADILALAARDAIYQIKGPFWPVPLGRKDGRVSIANEALTSLPSPFANITQLKANFASKGLNTKDLVALSVDAEGERCTLSSWEDTLRVYSILISDCSRRDCDLSIHTNRLFLSILAELDYYRSI
ncbi:peroxidase 27-like protein [Tanacetum coccineum]